MKLVAFSIIFIFNFFHLSSSFNRTNYRRAWNLLENFTVTSIRDLAFYYENELNFVLHSSNLSIECKNSLRKFVDGLKSVELDAVRRLDSWGRIPSGLLDGSWINLGAFSQCMESTSNQYCMLFVNMPLMAPHQIEGFRFGYDVKYFNFSSSIFKHVQPYIHHLRYINITSGICTPKECNRYELRTIAQNLSSNYATGLMVDVDMCQTRQEKNPFSFAEIVSLSIILFVIIITIIGMFVSKDNFCYHFNFVENYRKICKPRKEDASVPCLDGLKALNMLYMLTVHSFFTILYQNFLSHFRASKQITNPLAVSTIFGPFTMEAFFLFTGLETTLMFKQNHHKLPGYLFLILRWTRFVPVIGFTICLYIILFSNHVRDYIGGPYWNYYHATGSIAKLCPNTWWGHLLLIQYHFLTKDDVNVCLTPSWYLEVDYVFAILFVLLILPFIKKSKPIHALLISSSLIILGIISVGAILHVYNVQHSWLPMSYQQDNFVKYIVYIHVRPWAHFSGYFMGVMLAFVITSSKIKLNQTTKWILWFFWFSCVIILLTYEVGLNLNLIRPSYYSSLLYGSWNKVLFSYSIAWFIYVCHNGLITPSITNFLSSHVFTVFARLNLSAMFINCLVYRMRNATFHTSIDLTIFEYFYSIVIPGLTLIYLLSFINCILIEVPSVNLIKGMLMGNKDNYREKPINTELTLLETNTNKP